MMRLLRYMITAVAGLFTAFGGFLAGRRSGKRSAVASSTRKLPPSEPPARRSEIKTFFKRLAMLVPVLALGGFLLAASGIIPIKASSGHWAITEWFLNFSMARSVSFHSIGIKAPPLDDPVLVLKGAGHYEYGCLPCHGGPSLEHPRIPAAMTPHPPFLPPKIDEWDSEELFYIVKHGVKFTGMPAWPAQTRDDEVWAVVAFLERLPDLDADAYQALVQGPELTAGRSRGDAAGVDATARLQAAAPTDAQPAAPTADTTAQLSAPIEGLLRPEGIVPLQVSDRCARCHGIDGGGRDIGSFPRLAGQRPQYLFATMRAYADGERHSGIMEPIAAGLSDEEMRAIAFYYSRLDAAASSPAESDPEAVERGERIAREGIPKRRVPSCMDCHGPGSLPRNPFYPNLAGQYAEYIKLQLELFKDGRRGGSVYARIMHPTAEDLTPEQMRDVALYYATLDDGE